MIYDSIRMESCELDSIYDKYKDSIIIAVSPSYYLERNEGACRLVMIYKKHNKYLIKDCTGAGSAHRCALQGLVFAAEQIKIPKPIVFVAAAPFGFKKALKGKGMNPDLWNIFFDVLKEKGCPSVTEIVVPDGSRKIEGLCRESSR